jgi:hypothetical protein
MARKLDADFQPFVAGEFLVIITVGLLGFGEGGKLTGLFIHPQSIGESEAFPKTNHEAGDGVN